MATLYKRGNRVWLAWGHGVERKQKSTGYLVSEWDKAEIVKAGIERDMAAPKVAGLARPRSVGGYRKAWVQERRGRGVACANEDESWLRHARELDDLLLADVRPRHIRDLVLRLKKENKLAPRSIRHVFGKLHTMFQSALIEELVSTNPVVVERGVLPGKKDKVSGWRATAIYTREEVQTLISSDAIPEDRRLLYAFIFLTGMRIGEASDRRWRDYEDQREPLGCLRVHTSYNTKAKVSKGTKTDVERQVPVHVVLAKLLAAWKLGGWAKIMGRHPGPDDLIIPSRLGKNRTSNHTRNKLLEDLAKVGLRPRRTHDTRRTFISLGLADGARKDILKWVSHGTSADIMDLYSTIPWATLCEEVQRLNIRIVSTATVLLHPAAMKS